MVRVTLRLLKFSGQYRNDLILAFIYSFLFTAAEVCMFMAIMYALRVVVHAIEFQIMITNIEIRNAFFIVGGSVLGKIIFGSLSNSKLNLSCFNMCTERRTSIGNKLKKMPMGYFSNTRLGEVAAVVTTVINEIEFQFAHLFTSIISGLVHAILIAVIMTIFDWRIGIISIVGIILGLLINSVLQHHSKIISPKRQAAQTGLINAILEYVKGIAVIKAFGIGDTTGRFVDHAIEQSREKNMALESVFTKILAVYAYVFKLSSCAMVMAASYFLIGGEMTVENTLMIMVSSFVMFTKIESVGGAASFLQMIDENMDKIEAVENAPLMDDTSAKLNPKSFDIRFEEVSFSYDTRKILDGINLSIKNKQTVAIVGPSGSGKTTICNLLARFWDVDAGRITIGGEDIRDYTCESLLSHISMVFQKVYLFQDTILNNIRFAKPDATFEEVKEAAKKACCHDFIMALPEGYNTIVGEGGGSLSGGEKQRISIARAILKDAPIIILDEATSSVDPVNEAALHKGIEALTKHKTVIMIAHKLSTVEKVDNIFVLKDGQVIQKGKHDKLVQEDGLYKAFVDIKQRALQWSL